MVAVTLALSFSTTVRAEVNAGKAAPAATISVTPTLGSILFAPSGLLLPAFIYGMKVSYDNNGNNVSDALGVEATVNYFSAPSQSGAASASVYLLRADVIYSLFPKRKWDPFLVIGLGDFLVNQGSTSKQSLLLNYGLGIKYMLEEYLALRVDARYISMYSGVNPRGNFELTTGLSYLFGKEHKKKIPPTPLPKLKAIPDIDGKATLSPPASETLSDQAILERLGATGPGVVGITNTPPEFLPAVPTVPPPGARPLAFKPAPVIGAPVPAPAAPLEPPALPTPQGK